MSNIVLELAAARDPAKPHILHHDVETRSTADLTDVGAAKYAADLNTDVWLLGYAVDDEPIQLWTPPDPPPPEFFEVATNPLWTIGAHNDGFERLITQHILVPRYGFPVIPLERRRCSMAMAYACALPGALEKVVEALNLPYPKDKAGQTLMRMMSQPRKPRAGEDPNGIYWHDDDPEKLERLGRYCCRDVEGERAVYKTLPLLTAEEQKLWELDAVINDRGFAVDFELLEAAQEIVIEAEAKSQAEFHDLTGLDSTNQVEKFIAWLAAHDCIVKDMQKATISQALRRKELGAEVRRAIELRQRLAHASAMKVKALLAWRQTDNRVRGTLGFHIASTGRWAGRGPQPQNFRRDSEGIDAKIAAVMAGGANLESPLEIVGDITRAMITAAPGHRLMIGDFSGIESRMLAWISGQQSKLEQWEKFDRSGLLIDDPYFVQGRACGLPETIARANGKICDLAFGFGGAVHAWKKQAPETDTSTDDVIRGYQHHWHMMHPYTVGFWKNIDRNAIAAVRAPGRVITYMRLSLVCDGNFLRITLPSGRALSFPFPRIEIGKFDKPCVVFKDASTGKWADCRFGQGAYGGLWTQNITSALARDVLAGAMQRLEAAGYLVVLTVHDEVIAEVPADFGSLEEFRDILVAKPDWVDGNLPIAAKVRESERFAKSDSVAPIRIEAEAA